MAAAITGACFGSRWSQSHSPTNEKPRNWALRSTPAAVAENAALSSTYVDSFATTRSPSLRMKKLARAGLKSQIVCKTGHINGVLSLSGYLTSPSQERVAFSIIYNESKGYRGAEAVDMQEDVVKAIDAWLVRKR